MGGGRLTNTTHYTPYSIHHSYLLDGIAQVLVEVILHLPEDEFRRYDLLYTRKVFFNLCLHVMQSRENEGYVGRGEKSMIYTYTYFAYYWLYLIKAYKYSYKNIHTSNIHIHIHIHSNRHSDILLIHVLDELGLVYLLHHGGVAGLLGQCAQSRGAVAVYGYEHSYGYGYGEWEWNRYVYVIGIELGMGMGMAFLYLLYMCMNCAIPHTRNSARHILRHTHTVHHIPLHTLTSSPLPAAPYSGAACRLCR